MNLYKIETSDSMMMDNNVIFVVADGVSDAINKVVDMENKYKNMDVIFKNIALITLNVLL
jgi:hypothetical protein